jgi:DNA-directed RNA polymerase specialized sigma24 family protein
MTGSVLEGEDVVQDALFDAYRRLDTYDERRSHRPLAVSDCAQPLHRFSSPA